MFVAAMPALMGAFLGAEGSAPEVTFDTLFPNRLRLIDEYQRCAAEQGYRTDVDATAVVDALLGSLFMQLIDHRPAADQRSVTKSSPSCLQEPGAIRRVDRAIGSAILGCEYPECIVSMHRSQPR